MVRYILDLPETEDDLVNLIELIIAEGLNPDGKQSNPALHFLLIQQRLGNIAGIVYDLKDEDAGLLVEQLVNLSSECIHWINTLYTGAKHAEVQST